MTTLSLRAMEPDPVTDAATRPTGTARITRRVIRYALGVFWLLDGALQLQSYMFTKGFAHQILAPAASGQPFFVALPVRWNAELIATHPALFNACFAGVQLLLGAGFFFRRWCRQATAASVAWAVGVWYLGEGLGGLAGGHATALVGAPGAGLLYLVLALAAWPTPTPGRRSGVDPATPLPSWITSTWGVVWIAFALLDLLPGNGSTSTVAAELATDAVGVPSWLAGFDRWLATGVHGLGPATGIVLVAAEMTIGLASLGHGRFRPVAIWSGIALSALFWAAGQNFGQLFSGQATDPNTGPLLMVLGLAALGALSSRTQVARTLAITRTERSMDAVAA